MTSSKVPTGDSATPVETPEVVQPELSFEEQLTVFWSKHGPLVIGLCLVVLVGIVAYGGWEYFQRQRDVSRQKEYAEATTDDKLAAFAAAHASHPLGAAANARLGDTAAAAGQADAAVAAYSKALEVVKTGALASRLRLGVALEKILAGHVPEGTADLRRIAEDTNEFKAIRAEAVFHLGTLASAAGNTPDVQKYTSQLLQLAPASQWLQRLLALQPDPVAAPTPEPGSATPPTVSAPAPAAAGAAGRK